MGEIIGAGFLSHAPTIMFPKALRLALNEGKEISLVPGLERIRTEVLDVLQPDTIIIFDSHWFTTVEFVITAHQHRAGKYTSEELPRGMAQVPYNLAGNPALAKLIAEKLEANHCRCHASEDPYLPCHYPTINTAHFLNRGENWLSMSLPQTAKQHNFLAAGKGISEAIAASGQRVVIIASGGLSHRFWPLDELTEHEASDPIHIRTPEARLADEQRIEWWKQGNHEAVIDNMDSYYPHKPEGMFGHYLMMIGALGGKQCRAPGRQFGDYENATGTGQAHVWFDKPEKGWC